MDGLDIYHNDSNLSLNEVQRNELLALPLGFGLSNTPETRRIIHYTSGILLTIFGVLGVIGNSLVLYVFSRYQRLRTGGGPLILSLGLADLMVSILHILPAYSSFRESWAFGNFGCELYAGAVGLCGLASLITLSAIAADRFYVIFGRPITFLARQTTCLFIWCLSLFLVLPPFFGWSKFGSEGLGTSCSWDYSSRTTTNRLYYVFLLTFGFGFPVVIIVVSYIGIAIVVCQHSRALRGFSRNGIVSTTVSPTDIRTAQVVLTLILSFLVSWTPYAIVSFIGQFGPPGSLTQLGTSLPALFAKGACIYNPIIYGLSHPHFRSAVASFWSKQASSRNLAQNLCYQTNQRFTASNVQLNVFQTSSSFRKVTQRRVIKRPSDGNSSLNQAIPRIKTAETVLLLESVQREILETPRKGRQSLPSGSPRRQCQPIIQSTGRNTLVQQRQHKKPEALKSSPLKKFNYSAPDLHRDGKIVRNPHLITLAEYKRLKRKWLWKTLFRSENCLPELLHSVKFNDLAKLVKHKPTNGKKFKSPRPSPRHYPHPPVDQLRGHSSARSSISTATTTPKHLSPRRHTEPKIDEDGNRKKSTPSILHRANQGKRDSNLLALPIRFEDGILSGQEDSENTPSPTRRSSSGRKSSSSGSKVSGTLGRKNILELFTGHGWIRRKFSNNSEVTGVSHYTPSQRSGSQSKKYSLESSLGRHQWKYFLMHQRDCCECSFRLETACSQDTGSKRLFSFDS